MKVIMYFSDIHRQWKFFWQRKSRGFDDSELWSLDYTIAKFIAPRLTVLITHTKELGCVPSCLTQEDGSDSDNTKAFQEWICILEKMQKAFQLVLDEESEIDTHRVYQNNVGFMYTDEQQKQLDEGLELFKQYFNSLWT